MDLNVQSPVVKEFIKNTLINMCKKGASIIRLDAFAYAVKKANTSCFFGLFHKDYTGFVKITIFGGK